MLNLTAFLKRRSGPPPAARLPAALVASAVEAATHDVFKKSRWSRELNMKCASLGGAYWGRDRCHGNRVELAQPECRRLESVARSGIPVVVHRTAKPQSRMEPAPVVLRDFKRAKSLSVASFGRRVVGSTFDDVLFGVSTIRRRAR